MLRRPHCLHGANNTPNSVLFPSTWRQGPDRSALDAAAVRCDVDDPQADEEERDTEIRKSGYEIAQQVLLLAEKLDPTSLKIQRLLATTELIFGPYESAYRRLTHVIESAPSESDRDLADRFFCKKLRGRIGCLWVERERNQGNKSSSESIAFLAKAKDDLLFCERYLGLNHSSSITRSKSITSVTTKPESCWPWPRPKWTWGNATTWRRTCRRA